MSKYYTVDKLSDTKEKLHFSITSKKKKLAPTRTTHRHSFDHQSAVELMLICAYSENLFLDWY